MFSKNVDLKNNNRDYRKPLSFFRVRKELQ